MHLFCQRTSTKLPVKRQQIKMPRLRIEPGDTALRAGIASQVAIYHYGYGGIPANTEAHRNRAQGEDCKYCQRSGVQATVTQRLMQ